MAYINAKLLKLVSMLKNMHADYVINFCNRKHCNMEE